MEFCRYGNLLVWCILMMLGCVTTEPGDIVLVGYQIRGDLDPHRCVTPENAFLEISGTSESELQGCALFMLTQHTETDEFLLTDLTIAPPDNQLTLVGPVWQYTDSGTGVWFEDPENHFFTITGISSTDTNALTDETHPVQLKLANSVSFPGYFYFVPGACYVAQCLRCAESDVNYCETCPNNTTPNSDHSFCIACSTLSKCERCDNDTNSDFVADRCTQCQDDYFVNENGTCSLIDCGDPSEIDHGSLNVESTVINSAAFYECDEGYELIGQANVTCQDTMDWESAPSCTYCGFPNAPDSGTVTYTKTTYGATITYSCVVGMVIEGQSTATCEGNGRWSGSTPVCKDIDCGNITAPENGQVDFNSTLYGANASFTCSQNYTLIGDAKATCLDSGLWENIPFCQGFTSTTIAASSSSSSTNGESPEEGTPTPEAQSSDENNNNKSTIAIAGGIVVGVVLVVVAAIVVVIIYKVKKSKSRTTSADPVMQQHHPTASSALTYRGQAIAPLKPRRVLQDTWLDENEEKLPPEKMREAFGAPQQPQRFAGGTNPGSSSAEYGGTEMNQYNLPNSPPPSYQSHDFKRPKSSLIRKK